MDSLSGTEISFTGRSGPESSSPSTKRHVVDPSPSNLGDYDLGSGHGTFRKCVILETLNNLPIGPSNDDAQVGLAEDQTSV